MWKKYVPYVSSIIFFAAVILGITLPGAFIYGAVSSGGELFRAPLFFRNMADALFFEGGVILTFGALVEFLFKARSPMVAQGMMSPFDALSKQYAITEAYMDAPGEEGRSGGWMLIYLGALLLIASMAFAFASMK